MSRSTSRQRRVGVGAAASVVLSSLLTGTVLSTPHAHASTTLQQAIKHVVIIMQENRSFDEYFGTYPGANGISNAPSGACNPDAITGVCVTPYHDPADNNHGGGHGPLNVAPDINHGQMNGFVGQYYKHWNQTTCSPVPAVGTCSDAMGYKNATDIPNYWSYANNYVLQDAMFESIPSWSRTSHVAMVSGWSANCPKGSTDPMSCKSILTTGDHHDDLPSSTGDCDDYDPVPAGCGVPDYAWTDITYLLHKNNVSWNYFVGNDTPDMWKPIGDFQDVHANGQTGNVTNVSNFTSEAAAGTLPSVSWVIPGHKQSDHPALVGGALVSDSQAYTTSLINSVMAGPDWSSTAIYLTWDDWGGYYDHVIPPTIPGDVNGVGFREPALLISPYAKTGYIDHQNLTFESYLKFIEDDFLGGQRLDSTDGRPDSRPVVRENVNSVVGDLTQEFDFTQTPRPPMFLPELNVNTSKINPGATVILSGTHYAPNEPITFKLDCSWAACPSTTVLGSAVSDSIGNFGGVHVTIPAQFASNHLIGGVGGSGDWGGIPVIANGIPGDAAPVAALTVTPNSGGTPLNVVADASASTDSDSSPVASYTFGFGDGTVVGPQTSSSASHTYVARGTYTVRVTVTDTANLSSSTSATVTATSTNLVGNPGFETDTSGWKAGPGTTLGLSTTAHSGNQSAQLTSTSAPGRVTLNDFPGWNNSTVAGTTCVVSAWVLGPTGNKISDQATESSSTGKVAQAVADVKSTGAWAQLSVSAPIVNNGDNLRLAFFTTLAAGQALLVDDVSEACQ